MRVSVRLLMLCVVAAAMGLVVFRQHASVKVLPEVPGSGAQAGWYFRVEMVWADFVYADTKPGGRRVEFWPSWRGPSVLCRF